MPQKTFTKGELADIRQKYEAGTPVHIIGQDLECGHIPIRRALLSMGIEPRKGSTSRTKSKRNVEIIRMADDGKTMQEIADIFGLSKQYVHRIVTRGY